MCDSVLKIVKLAWDAFIASTCCCTISNKEQFFMDVFLFYSPFEMISVSKTEAARVPPAFNGAINMFRFHSVVIWNMFSENLKLWKTGFMCFGVHLHMLAAELYRDLSPSDTCSATLSRLID